jgi:hypothetical protein
MLRWSIVRDADHEIREAADHQTERGASQDVERRMRPQIQARERHERDDQSRKDTPTAAQVRGDDPRQPGDEHNMSGHECRARRRGVSPHDRIGDRRAWSRSAHEVPHRSLRDELRARDQQGREPQAPPPKEKRNEGDDRTDPENAQELRDHHRRRERVREPVDRPEDATLLCRSGVPGKVSAARRDIEKVPGVVSGLRT